MNPNAKVVFIPLAIDHRLYPFSTREPEIPTIGVIGNMNWGPTRMASARLLTDIWPLVKGKVHGLRLMIAGWGARRMFTQYLRDPDITILEDLPEAEPYFRRLSLLVFPLTLGSGTKVKVQEAMAYGVPVVTTEEGIHGIQAKAGVHAALGNDDETLAHLIVELMRNREARHTMRLAARKLIEEKHSPEPILKQIASLFEMATAGIES
jgi:glycosyltransferase involved in cell wall biosynthesis